MADKIQKTDTLNEGRIKLNEAIKDAESAKDTSAQADDKATQALVQSASTQTQLDTVIIDGDSSVEAAQARVDEKDEVHPTLKARIDDGFTEVTSQLAEIAYNINMFGQFGTENDNLNFIDACAYISEQNGTLLIKDKVINLVNVTVENFPNVISNNSTIIVNGECVFKRNKNNFNLENVNITATSPSTKELFNVTEIEGIKINNFSFKFNTLTANRFEKVFQIRGCKKVTFDSPVMEGMNIGITVTDNSGTTSSEDITMNNPTFRNCKTGIFLSGTEEKTLKTVVIRNPILVNTETQANMFTGTDDGADLLMISNVDGIKIYDPFAEFPIERIGYFNRVKNLYINHAEGVNAEGIKVCGSPTNFSSDFTIGGIRLKNDKRGGYAFRSYFSKDGRVGAIEVDNSKMTVKPDSAISFSGVNENIVMESLTVDGLNRGILVNRIDDLGSIFGYAFVTYTPLLKNVSIRGVDAKNICLSNIPILDFIWYMNPNNPSPSTILDGKTIIDSLAIEGKIDINKKTRNFAILQNINNLSIQCDVNGIESAYSYNIIAYNDDLSKSATKTFKMNLFTNDEAFSVNSTHEVLFQNTTNDSFINVHLPYSTYKISNKNKKINAEYEVKDIFYDTNTNNSTYEIISFKVATNEKYVISYKDEVVDAVVTIVDNVLTITKPHDNFMIGSSAGYITIGLSGSGWVTIRNRTTSSRLASVKVTKVIV